MSQDFIVIFKPTVLLKSHRVHPFLNEMIAENLQELAKVMANDDRENQIDVFLITIFNRLSITF